jgi:prepilin-type N-terminal cleavage/methylation domain-containing protein
MKSNCRVSVRSSDGGFSLLELMIAASVMLILVAMVTPKVMTEVYSVKIRYSASDLAGLLQRTRMEAVRKNTFYSLYQTALPGNVQGIYIDTTAARTGLLTPTDPQITMAGNVTAFYGPGSGAPGEAAFIGGLGFAVAGAGTTPSFNARGLPCVNPAPCAPTPGQGFVFFVSGANSSNGSQGWSSVAVTPSGRVSTWAYDGANWIQQ